MITDIFVLECSGIR